MISAKEVNVWTASLETTVVVAVAELEADAIQLDEDRDLKDARDELVDFFTAAPLTPLP